jgi:hypothetical protein
MNLRNLAKGLGWFSLGLGATQLLAPEWLGRQIGVGEEKAGVMRALGAREALTGISVLMQRKPTLPIWGRVAGDAMDLALLAAALRSPRSERGRVAGATGMVLGVGLLDYACARMLQAA